MPSIIATNLFKKTCYNLYKFETLEMSYMINIFMKNRLNHLNLLSYMTLLSFYYLTVFTSTYSNAKQLTLTEKIFLSFVLLDLIPGNPPLNYNKLFQLNNPSYLTLLPHLDAPAWSIITILLIGPLLSALSITHTLL